MLTDWETGDEGIQESVQGLFFPGFHPFFSMATSSNASPPPIHYVHRLHNECGLYYIHFGIVPRNLTSDAHFDAHTHNLTKKFEIKKKMIFAHAHDFTISLFYDNFDIVKFSFVVINGVVIKRVRKHTHSHDTRSLACPLTTDRWLVHTGEGKKSARENLLWEKFTVFFTRV